MRKLKYIKNFIKNGSCEECGNSSSGCGFPGERQVTNPEQDIDNAPRITQSETSIAADFPFILMGFNDSNDTERNNLSGYAFSSDGGITWNDCGSMPQNPGWENIGDPSLAVDRRGIFYYAHLGTTDEGQSIVQISTGTVDRRTRRLHMNNPFIAGTGEHAGGHMDKEWIAVGPDPARGRCAEAIYMPYNEFPPEGEEDDIKIRFTKLSTGVRPQTLIPPKTIVTSEYASGVFPVVDEEGNVYIFYEDANGDYLGPRHSIRMVKSTDGGETFSEPMVIANIGTARNAIVRCGGNRDNVIRVTRRKIIRMNEFPQAAIGEDGTLYVVWNDGRNIDTTGIDIYLAYSTDRGNTWHIRQITSTATHEFFPSVTTNSLGAHIQYSRFDGDKGVENGRFALFMKAFSIKRGLSPERMVSTVFSLVPDTHPNFDPGIADCYMGDYNQIISGPKLTLYHAWGDNRNDPLNGNNPDVFFIQTSATIDIKS